ncbi:hypothetical protein ACOSQ2_004280 [Xanthoceras sorbifolium]
MDLGARRYTRNDILRDICCLIAPPIYSFIYKGCRNEDCRRALIFLLLEVISFVLDLLGGNHWVFLLASFILSACNSLIIMYAYFVVKRYSRIKLEAGQKDIVVEIVFSCLQLIVSGFCLIRTLLGVNTNYSASVFPLAYAIISVLFAFKNCKGVSNTSSNTSTNSPNDQIVEVEHTDQLQLNDIQVDPPDTPTDQIGDVEDTKTSQLSNICDVEPSSRHSNEVQQVPNTLRKRRNTSAQSDDQGQVDSSNIPIAQTGDSGDTNPSQLSNICDAKPSDTPNKDFIPSSSHSDEVQQVPNILTKCRNTFTQSDQGEENETGLGVTVGSRPTDQIGNVEDTKTLQLSNICDVEPSSSQHSNDVQQIPNTLRSTFAQSDDQGQVHPSNTRIAQIGNAEDTNPSPLSNTCEPSDTPNKDFVPSRSHSDEVQQVPNILRKRKNTFTQSDQGEENKIAHSLFSCEEKNLTPGDWNCVLCHQLNFQRRVSCQRCGEPRTGYHKGSFGGRISGIAGPDVRPGDWYCLNCTDHNFASRSSCFKCGASKDEPGSDMPNIRDFGFGSDSSGRKSGDWICTKFD